MHPLQAHCHFGLGALYGKIGRREQTEAELFTATELFRAMEMTFWLIQAEMALAYAESLKRMSYCDSRSFAQAPTRNVYITSVEAGIQAYLRP